MPRYEYLTVPAPRKGEKAKGLKTSEARIAQAMQSVLNEKGAEGWDYLRADLLPMEERAGIASKTVNYHTVLVFRRTVEAKIEGRDFGAYPELEMPQEEPEDTTSDEPMRETLREAFQQEDPNSAARPVLRAEKTPSDE